MHLQLVSCLYLLSRNCTCYHFSLELLQPFQQSHIIRNRLAVFDFDALAALTGKIFLGYKLEKCIIYSKLIGNGLPTVVEMVISEDEVEKLFNGKGTELYDLCPILSRLDDSNVLWNGAQLCVLKFLIPTPQVLLHFNNLAERYQDSL